MIFTISIVSHGHSETLLNTLRDLNFCTGSHSLQVFVTWNAPELEAVSEEFLKATSTWPITIFKNKSRKGFAENHNAALSSAAPGIWCVLNPDIRIFKESLLTIGDALLEKATGLVFPEQISPSDEVLDYKRELVTPWSLFKRYIFQSRNEVQYVDWVSGCFMAFRSEVFSELGGFDEKYFLYCEDVDICLRLQLAGYKMAEADFSIIHDTRRGTLKKWDHFKWHVSSLLKLWCSRVFWAYLWNRHNIRQR
jgi:N-acetylglucosaminyl-diphospho-decaprenol L-rhamnosyltransferase